MSDELADKEPTPVLPLEYFQTSLDSWRPMVRTVAWLVLLLEGYLLLSSAIDAGCYFWQSLASGFPSNAIDGFPLLLRAPIALAALIMFIGSIDMFRLVDHGRRWVVGGALMMMIVVPPTEICSAFYYHIARNHMRYGAPYAVMWFAKYMLGSVGGCFFPYFVWRFFRRSEVRSVFHQTHVPARGETNE